ncbi:MAG: MtrB/PioB family outer membrane beta-barrel protein [Desulfuromonadales bacterium]|nr:MtrB/PioB family outer membrane beta-barrel protein [Desulfuromonadales bacterium]
MKSNRHHGLALLILGVLGLVIPPEVQADTEDLQIQRRTEPVALSVGYTGYSLQDQPGRAAEFTSFDSGPTFGVHIFQDSPTFTLSFDGNYLGENEHQLITSLSAKGRANLTLRSDRFVHNLDHIPYAADAQGSRPDSSFGSARGGQTVFYSDANPADSYRLRLDFNEARLKIKAPDYPAHFNLNYWRYEKKGDKQLRFVDHGSSSCTSCHMQSRTRPVDRVTDEVKASIDAHVGYIDLALEGLYRQFRERQQIPVDTFSGYGRLAGGDYPHDETVDSTLKEVSLKISTAPSGSLVGGMSLTLGQRENRSDLTTDGPIDAETDFTKVTADLTYTPSAQWTYSFRYRWLDMDNDNSARLTRYAGAAADLPVREAIDIERAWYEAVVNYRPWHRLTFKGEFRAEEIERNFNASQPWDLPATELVSRFKLGFQSRLLDRSALNLQGWYAYVHSDDPAYGISLEDRHEIFLSSLYTSRDNWGLSASVTAMEEENSSWEIKQLSRNGSLFDFDLDREQSQQRLVFGGWISPANGVTFDLNYGYLRTAIHQDLLFGISPSLDPTENKTARDNNVEYRQTVQTLTAGLSWQATDRLGCRLEGYHIRSKADFSPDFYLSGISYANGIGNISSTSLREISKVDIVQNGARARFNWQMDDNWSCTLEATYDSYDEKGTELYDGAAKSAMVSLARSW